MQNDHYAILVGIDHYPQLGQGNTPLDLRGPRNDVAAVRQWLRDPAGGGFADDSTIFEFQAPAGTPPGAAMPTAAQLDDLVAHLDQIAQDNKDQGRGRQVGRRIYIYLSGHGFSPGRQRACLFTADAQERLGHNVHATGWLSWLQDSGYFREFVLWVDACMDRAAFLPPHDPPLPLTTSLYPPLANFVAFAAQRPLRAVELPIEEDGGKVHGVFTWTLLEGLRGAAADVNGRVTGRSLADWVRNAMVARYGDAERKDPNVAQEPEVIQEDAGLIFARGLAAPQATLKLSFPPAAQGRQARIWSGAPPRVVQSFTVAAAGNEVALKPGLYLAEVPDQALRQGFEVLRPGAVQVGDAGAPARACDGSEIFTLSIDPRDPTAEIFVIDSRFSLVDRGVATLGTRLPAGLFKSKVRVGNATRQDVVLLDGDATLPAAAAPPQQLTTVLPLPDTAATHEYHEAGRRRAVDAARALQAQPGEAVLLCLVRSFSSRDAPVPPAQPPWQGMQVLDAQGQLVLDMEHDAQVETLGDPLAFAVKKLAPGCYFLRQALDGQGVVEQSLVLAAGWRTEVYTLRRTTAQAQDAQARPRSSVLMGRLGADLASPEEDRVLEVARQALADERKILNPELEDLLMRKFDDPVAGIIGGHLLLVERERDPARDLGRLDGVVQRLRALVGAGHPDVEALALRCADPQLRQVQGLAGPPMFQRSWALLAAAAADQPALVPPEVWARVHALSAMQPFLVWNTGDEVKAAARRALAEALFAPEAPAVAPALAVPPAALAGAPALANLAAVPAAVPATAAPVRRRRGAAAAPERLAAPVQPAAVPARPAPDLALAQRRAARMGVPASIVESLRADLDP